MESRRDIIEQLEGIEDEHRETIYPVTVDGGREASLHFQLAHLQIGLLLDIRELLQRNRVAEARPDFA